MWFRIFAKEKLKQELQRLLEKDGSFTRTKYFSSLDNTGVVEVLLEVLLPYQEKAWFPRTKFYFSSGRLSIYGYGVADAVVKFSDRIPLVASTIEDGAVSLDLYGVSVREVSAFLNCVVKNGEGGLTSYIQAEPFCKALELLGTAVAVRKLLKSTHIHPSWATGTQLTLLRDIVCKTQVTTTDGLRYTLYYSMWKTYITSQDSRENLGKDFVMIAVRQLVLSKGASYQCKKGDYYYALSGTVVRYGETIDPNQCGELLELRKSHGELHEIGSKVASVLEGYIHPLATKIGDELIAAQMGKELTDGEFLKQVWPASKTTQFVRNLPQRKDETG